MIKCPLFFPGAQHLPAAPVVHDQLPPARRRRQVQPGEAPVGRRVRHGVQDGAGGLLQAAVLEAVRPEEEVLPVLKIEEKKREKKKRMEENWGKLMTTKN